MLPGKASSVIDQQDMKRKKPRALPVLHCVSAPFCRKLCIQCRLQPQDFLLGGGIKEPESLSRKTVDNSCHPLMFTVRAMVFVTPPRQPGVL